MATRVTGDAIPKSGIINKIQMYITHVTGRTGALRFLWQGIIFLLLKQFPTIVGTYVRPLMYRGTLGKVKGGCLIERDVRLEVPSRIFLSSRVFLGEHCWISAGSIDGEIRLDNDVFIAHRCTLSGQGGGILIGDHVHVSRNTYINGIGGVEIGRDTMLGPNVVIISGNHDFGRTDIPVRLQGGEKQKITIGEDVWLAANVCVMPGVTIGKGSIIGAGAVVTRDTPEYSISVGVPAKVVGSRKDKSDN
jgi:acetyltransferase-like isoleucine patch superfamily enzyme